MRPDYAPPVTLRHVSGKVDYLRRIMQDLQVDHDELWFALLARHVHGANDLGQFDDVLAHPRFASIAVDVDDLDDVFAECSIAEQSVLYEFLLADHAMASKRDNGQFFTPDDVAQFIAHKASEFPDGVWLDPCSGIGNLSWWLVAAADDPEEFLRTNLRVSDLDERALLSARVLLTVAFQQHCDDLFTELEPHFRIGDFLARDADAPPPFAGEHDYVLMNPPYVQASAPSSDFASANSRDLYAYFLERAITSSRGVVAITPQTFTNGGRHRDLRRVILECAGDCSIYCFDNVPDTIFRGFKFGSENSNQVNSTRAAITVALRDDAATPQPATGMRITPLVRWTSAQRRDLFDVVDDLLAEPLHVTDELFPKVPRGLEELYDQMQAHDECLADIVQPHETEWRLNVPTTPRYYISAVARDLSRSSMRTFCFASEADWRRAYLMLNSSLAYFWWRVRDGGMTLSKATLDSLPMLPPATRDSRRIRGIEQRLRASEADNLVFKMNAGKANENVKHPLDLIADVNELFAPEHARTLLALHENSTLDHFLD